MHHLFLSASQMAEESLEWLVAAELAAAEGRQEDARRCLKAVGLLAETDLAAAISETTEALALVAEGVIAIHGHAGARHYASAHAAIHSLWLTAGVLSWQPDPTFPPTLLEWLGVNCSALRAYLIRERAKVLAGGGEVMPPLPADGAGKKPRRKQAEQTILEALGVKEMNGREIATAAGYNYEYVRQILPAMCDGGALVKTARGYKVAPERV